VNAANRGIAIQLIHREAARAPRLAQRFQRDVEPDLVAILETIGHGLRHVVDADRLPFNTMRLDTLGQRVRATMGEGVEEGIAEDVDGDGSLLIRREDGSLAVVEAGDVTLRG